MGNKDTFHYTYSAKEQTEIKNLRKKYEKKTEQEDKMEQLRRLDASATSKAIIIGVIGTLILGL